MNPDDTNQFLTSSLKSATDALVQLTVENDLLNQVNKELTTRIGELTARISELEAPATVEPVAVTGTPVEAPPVPDSEGVDLS